MKSDTFLHIENGWQHVVKAHFIRNMKFDRKVIKGESYNR